MNHSLQPETPAALTPSLHDSTCPRCGNVFQCGAQGAGPCACAGLSLPAALQHDLRGRYQGCLCLACLRSLAAGETAL